MPFKKGHKVEPHWHRHRTIPSPRGVISGLSIWKIIRKIKSAVQESQSARRVHDLALLYQALTAQPGWVAVNMASNHFAYDDVRINSDHIGP